MHEVQNHSVTRRQIKENWDLLLFSSTKGNNLIPKILERAKPSIGRKKRV